VHVVNPVGTRDLTAQVRYGLHGRAETAFTKTVPPERHIYGHTLSWRDLAGSILMLLRQRRTKDVSALIGLERELLVEHDRRGSCSR
jgi:hypothetical protein